MQPLILFLFVVPRSGIYGGAVLQHPLLLPHHLCRARVDDDRAGDVRFVLLDTQGHLIFFVSRGGRREAGTRGGPQIDALFVR